MKSPISLLTFSSLSVSACVLAQYLSSDSVKVLLDEVLGKGFEWGALYYCISRLSSLLFGIFLYYRNTENRAEGTAGYANHYFSVFSLVLSVIIPVLIFAHGAYIFALYFAALLFLFVVLLLFAFPSQQVAVNACGAPMLLFSILMSALAIAGIIRGW